MILSDLIERLEELRSELGDDVEELEHGRHGKNGGPKGQGSNYAFADGSSRFLRYGRSLSPINLWAVSSTWRTNTATFNPQ